MDSSIYIMLSRQMAQFQNMEMTANNIANMNTPGFSAQKMVFNKYLVGTGDDSQKDAYTDTPNSFRDTSSGPLQQTGNALDLAISGTGYFQVETPLGKRYTKAGNFQMNAEGQVVNVNGYPVLGPDGGQVTIPAGAKNIEINGVGQILVDGKAGGQIGVVEFADQQKMTRLGNSLFDSQEQPTPTQTSRVVQGAIESSNVNGVSEMVRVMDISRGVDNSGKFIQTTYDLEEKASDVLSKTKQS